MYVRLQFPYCTERITVERADKYVVKTTYLSVLSTVILSDHCTVMIENIDKSTVRGVVQSVLKVRLRLIANWLNGLQSSSLSASASPGSPLTCICFTRTKCSCRLHGQNSIEFGIHIIRTITMWHFAIVIYQSLVHNYSKNRCIRKR